MSIDQLSRDTTLGLTRLRSDDPVLYGLLEEEQRRPHEVLAMIASASVADPSVLICEATATSNVTTEGYPGKRFHAGCATVDQIERLATERARQVFGARYANVQPHSGSTANQLVITSLLDAGDTILSLGLDAGGHLTHGAAANFSGRYFQVVNYGVGADGLLDYDRIEQLAVEHRPRMIICGASAYPRIIDFARFRRIADRVGAYLLADISHIAGLVAAGLHPSPVDHAHVTTTSTYKQLCGPRGGLVLLGRDADSPVAGSRRTLAATIEHAVFPYFQGTPRLNTIAAKARAFDVVGTAAFRELATRIVANARTLADELGRLGWPVLTGGTDNHMVLTRVLDRGLTGVIAEKSLESCGILVNRNKIPDDPTGPLVGAGVRFGTNVLAQRGFDDDAVRQSVRLVDRVWRGLTVTGDRAFTLPDRLRDQARAEVAELCARFPLPDAPAPLGGFRAEPALVG